MQNTGSGGDRETGQILSTGLKMGGEWSIELNNTEPTALRNRK